MKKPQISNIDLGLFCDYRDFANLIRGVPYEDTGNVCVTIRVGNLELVHS
ncbi:hypothetical protein DFP94_1011458 [Fontibacillus phaseoli]|uniref:Uncharacterized protein n=1 Tax=Fontibacillus phaseoli TaxID=1416533 RepID=A0A369BW38_9BACL|nr:hypothetical protein DFP94_1011458 [Fontibacillus phaseoli]